MSASLGTHLQPLDLDGLRGAFRAAEPFPHIEIPGFLVPDFARDVVAAFPSEDEAARLGKTFRAVNESGKTQITDTQHFGDPIRSLHEVLASPEWLATLSTITGIPDLLADDQLVGGGMHVMKPDSHLDVHIDFNRIDDRMLYRRLNILVFLNEGWREEWGGALELWNPDVTRCHRRFLPELNRCVVFETSPISFHGVTRLTTPPGRQRRSFAAYYYTKAPPSDWDGQRHTTIFKARPDEKWKGRLLMPAAKALRAPLRLARRLLRGPVSRDSRHAD